VEAVKVAAPTEKPVLSETGEVASLQGGKGGHKQTDFRDRGAQI